MSENRVYIRVIKDGKKVNFELIVDQIKVGNPSRSQVVEMLMQFASSLRYE